MKQLSACACVCVEGVAGELMRLPLPAVAWQRHTAADSVSEREREPQAELGHDKSFWSDDSTRLGSEKY